MSNITLFDYARSSACYRVRIALNLAGLSYDKVLVNLLKGEHRAEAHKERNPQGLVPVLAIDGMELTQSLAIIEYLNASRGLKLLPDENALRAKVQALAHSLAIDVHPVCNLRVANHALEISNGGDETRIEWMQHFIRPGLLAFEALLAGLKPAPYAVGDQPGLAEICLIPQLYNADRWGAVYHDCPNIRAIKTLCDAHPAFVDAHPDME